jgi:hypothetical protein
MLETALLFTTLSTWLPWLGMLDLGTTTTTVAEAFFGLWAVAGVAALVFHKPIERYSLAHHTQPA